ncbi:MAG TPA: hypothetical protein VGM32_05700 [Rhodopila sp.]
MRAAPLGLTAASAALCFVIANEVQGSRQGDLPSPAAQHSAAPPRVTAEPSAAPNRQEAWLEEIMGRPLFSPGRRPIEGGVRGLPRLTGIVVAGSQRVAIFASSGSDHPLVAQAGSHVGPYEVLTIDDTGVTVRGPEGTTLIRPIFDPARPTPPTPQRAPAPRPPAR